MASLILSTVGNAAFGPIGGFLGALAGSAIDNAAITALTPARLQPSRLAGLKVQASQEGAAIPIVYGRFRVAGQIIWASKFHEINTKRTVGGKGGQRVVERSYTISFAIGLAEGPIDGLGRVWVNGEAFDLSTVTHRVYLGGEAQMPDPLIEAVEGLANAPAFRGLAYVVFEDFAVSGYGDRIPQFGFEVMASAANTGPLNSSLRDLARGVCLIPGAGEFAYATTPIRKIIEPGHEIGENLHVQSYRSDFDVSLDNLARDYPRVDNISLVVAWFGTDLRAGQCQIIPKVEDATKQTSPRAWHVAGLTRSQAGVVSQVSARPAYGGSPDDESVIEAILALKSRGHRVTHNPFVMMDVASGNALPNPMGGSSQPPYPWRGRITCYPGIGQPSSADASGVADSQIAAFFGTANASHFNLSGDKAIYSGPDEWSYRRFILHQAALCVVAGGVDAFLIGSELIGLTRVRGASGNFPAVDALIALAGQVRALLGPLVKISYGADWTEYCGYQPPGSNDLRFPLDPLWANANIDFVGLDWYAPISDRRAGEARLDIAALQAGIEAGEGFDFYYANDAHRRAKTRTPITDGAYNEPWVWRQKDVRGFWSNPHYERFGGVRATTPTAWVPMSKPLALMELGFPAVDKGANRPSVFPDPKSSEAGLPPFSSGARDDIEQRLALEATLTYWRDHNTVSSLYAGNMMDMSRCHIWAWDARPFPHFPELDTVWADGTYAMLGHWLAGRAGDSGLRAVVGDICRRGGLAHVDVDGVTGHIDGFAIEAPTSARSVLENLFAVFGLEATPRPHALVITDTAAPIAQATFGASDIISRGGVLNSERAKQSAGETSSGRFSCYSSERDYLPATHTTPPNGQAGGVNALACAVVLDPVSRHQVANHLARASSGEGLSLKLGPAVSARLDVGDRFSLDDGVVWRVDRCEGQLSQSVFATLAQAQRPQETAYVLPSVSVPPVLYSAPILVVLDVTAPFTSPNAPQPLVGCTSDTWPGNIDVLVGDKVLGTINAPMTLATTVSAIPTGPVGRLIHQPIVVDVKFGASWPKAGQAALLENDRVVDIISWRNASLLAQGRWQVGAWVRGLNGVSEGPALPAGTRMVLLDSALVEMALDPSLVGVSLSWQARPLADVGQTTSRDIRFQALALQPWSPCALAARRTIAGIELSWTRRARGNGDAWASANAPLGASIERYEIIILSQTGIAVRNVSVTTTTWTYLNTEELADFGSLQNQIRVAIRQIGDDDVQGIALNALIAV